MYLGNSDNLEKPKFLTSNAKKALNYLRQAFIEVPILRHFNLECHIRIETNASDYTIRKVLSQPISNQVTSDRTIRLNVDCHTLAYFSKKMIFAETRYKTHEGKLWAIVEAFKP